MSGVGDGTTHYEVYAIDPTTRPQRRAATPGPGGNTLTMQVGVTQLARKGDLISNGLGGDGWIVLKDHVIPSTPTSFYRVGESNNHVHYTAGASCTGEGVPGSGV